MIPGMGRDPQADNKPTASHGLMLVLDESLPVRQKMVEILQKLGSANSGVIEAGSAEEALALFRKHRPSIVFAEFVGVHPEDGLDVLHEMLDADPTARIVLVTAEPRESAEVRAALRAGIFALIEKPLRYEKIRAVLSDLESEEGGIERYR